MKKLFAILLSLFLVLGVAAAETTEEMKEEVMNWEDVAEMAANIEGDFVSVADLGLYMYLPSSFTALEVTEEQKTAGVIALLGSEELGGSVSITYQNVGEMDFEAYLNELKSAGATGLEKDTVNGLTALSYDLEVNGVKTSSLVFEEGENNIITFCFGPMDNENFQPVAFIMGASINAGE